MINAKSSKAHYRSALALVALERYEEAVDSCSRCLIIDPANQQVSSLKAKAEKLHDEKVKKEREKERRLREADEKRRRLQVAFKVCCAPDPSSKYMLTWSGRKGTLSSFLIPRERQKWIINLVSTKWTLAKELSSSRSTFCIPSTQPRTRRLTSLKTRVLAITWRRCFLRMGNPRIGTSQANTSMVVSPSTPRPVRNGY